MTAARHLGPVLDVVDAFHIGSWRPVQHFLGEHGAASWHFVARWCARRSANWLRRVPRRNARWPPKSYADRIYNITQWTEMPRGGHFAAMEEPDLLLKDIQKFARSLA